MNEKILKKVAGLSRLHFDSNDLQTFSNQMTIILDYMEQINEWNNVLEEEKIDPDIASCHGKLMSLRSDDLSQNKRDYLEEKSLRMSEDHYFFVPKVIDNS